MSEVTRILSAIEQGDPHAAEQLLPLVYDELRKLAAAQTGPREARPDAPADRPGPRGLPPPGRTGDQPQHWNSRGHFFAAAAEAMRRILVEPARRKKRRKHGGERQRIELDEATRPLPTAQRTCWPLTRRSTRLAAARSREAAELVKLRYFAGLTLERSRRSTRHLAAHGLAVLGLRPGLAVCDADPARRLIFSEFPEPKSGERRTVR